jgi:hypothetical protein
MCGGGLLCAQTQILITSTYQPRGQYERAEEQAFLQAARDFLTANQAQETIAFFCDPSGKHFTFGHSNATMHLDSIASGAIERPYRLSWPKSGQNIIQTLIDNDITFREEVSIDVFTTNEVIVQEFTQSFLKPWAFVFDGADVAGQLSSRITVNLHSNFFGNEQHKVVQISSLTTNN